jgi:hypothetical protein
VAQSQKSAEYKRKIWSERIASWKQSGLSQRAYCEQHQLVLGTFCYWRSRLKAQELKVHKASPRFLPVTLTQSKHVALILKIDDRHSIEIKPDFDPELLSKVVRAVQQIA